MLDLSISGTKYKTSDIITHGLSGTSKLVAKQRKVLHKELTMIHKTYKKNFKQYKKLKMINTISKMLINFLNATTVSTIVITYSSSFPILYVSLASSTVASLISVLLDSYNINDKISRFHTTYLQLLDIFNVYRSKYIKTKDSNELDELINELNVKVGLILDSANLVSISSTD